MFFKYVQNLPKFSVNFSEVSLVFLLIFLQIFLVRFQTDCKNFEIVMKYLTDGLQIDIIYLFFVENVRMCRCFLEISLFHYCTLEPATVMVHTEFD